MRWWKGGRSIVGTATSVVVMACGVVGCSSRAPVAVKARDLTGFRSAVLHPAALGDVNAVAVAPVIIGPEVVENVPENEVTRELVEAMRSEWGEHAFPKGEGTGDAVLTTQLRQMIPREGSAIGSSRPARLEFEMVLRDRKSDRALWRGDYFFGDKPLTDNLLELKKRREGGGAGWKNSRELLASAFRAAARDLADRREQLFIRRGDEPISAEKKGK